MKTLLLLTALVAATATAALADGASRRLPETTEFAIRQLVPDADLSNLTNEQYVRLSNLFSSSANLRSSEGPAQRIKIILADKED